MNCTVVRKEESTEISDISEAEISIDPVVTYECIVSDRVYDYYFDELEESQADQVANHLEDCSYCQEIYSALENVATTLKRNPQKFFAKEIAAGRARKKNLLKTKQLAELAQ